MRILFKVYWNLTLQFVSKDQLINLDSAVAAPDDAVAGSVTGIEINL